MHPSAMKLMIGGISAHVVARDWQKSFGRGGETGSSKQRTSVEFAQREVPRHCFF